MRSLLYRIAALCLCLIVSSVHSNALLPEVPRLTQQMPNWCWIGTTKMVLDYYNRGALKTQTDICKHAMGGQTLDLPGALTGGPASQKAVDVIIKDLKSINSTYTAGVLSMSDFASSILGSKPIFIGYAYFSGGNVGHAVVGVGFDTQNGSNTNIGPAPANEITAVFFNDPGDGTRSKRSFAVLRKNSQWEWKQTLRPTTAGPTPPVGIHDKVVIENFTYQYIHPFTTKTAFAKFYSVEVPVDHCYSFNWPLGFLHSGGEYTARSGTVNGTDQSTWSISPFDLPAGYAWKFHPEGAVNGNLKVNCTDNSGYNHSDAKSVLFYPSGYYPLDVLYENKTTSSQQSDVKAHNWIGMQSDNLNSGTKIKFRAGSSLAVYDGVNIGNGSIVDFIIDPSLR